MKATVHEEAPCRRALEVEVPEDEVRKQIDRMTAEYARNLALPGFRKGKVPKALVRTRYAKEIEGEVIERLARDYSLQVIEEKELVPIRPPVVEKYRYKEGEPLTFRTTFEIRPSFTLGTYKALEGVRKRPPVTEELVDKHLDGLREQNARFDAVEERALQEGDFAVVDLQPLDDAGEAKGKLREGVTLDLGPEGVAESLRGQLLGIEPGQEREVTIESSTPAGGGEGDAAQTEPTPTADRYRVRLRAVRQRVLPDLDDDFAKDIGPFDSLEALRQRLREDLGRRADDQAERDLRESLVKQLVDAHVFDVPDGLVETELNHMLEGLVSAIVQQGADPSRVGIDWEKKRAELRPVAEQRVRADLILDEIGAREELEVSDDEVLGALAEQARREGTTPKAVRARLEEDGRLNLLKTKMLREKSLDLVTRSANIIG